MFKVLTNTIGKPEDCWTVSEVCKTAGKWVEKPLRFETREEAQAEIDEIIAEAEQQIIDGQREPDEGYSQDDYTIEEA